MADATREESPREPLGWRVCDAVCECGLAITVTATLLVWSARTVGLL